MAIGDIIVGIDIGTSKVSLVIGEVNNFNQIEVICTKCCRCNGIKKTKIIDEDEIGGAISRLIKEAETENELTINSAYLSIPGKYVTIVQNSILKEAKDKYAGISTKDVYTALSQVKDIDIPDTFNLHLDITKVRGLEANYQWSEEDEKKYGRDAGYYKYEGDWSFDIPVTVDDSQTEVLELNDTNDAGIGLKSVIRTPYELTVNELYKEGSNSDCFMVALDANGNTLPYNESTGNCNNFAIQDRDISTVDIYFLDYVQYMDELKGQQNFDNPTKEDGQKWKKLLEENAKYHKTLHFDNDNVKN